MCHVFNPPGKTIPVPGFAGKHKIDTELIITKTQRPGISMVSIIRADGTHISSFSEEDYGIRIIIENGFWVLRDRSL